MSNQPTQITKRLLSNARQPTVLSIATASPRKTPDRRRESSESRERVLKVAARLFHQQGYTTTTVRDIARELGRTSGSLFHHFSSKDAMLLEIMRDAAHAVCERAEAILIRDLCDEEALRELIRL